MAATNPRQEPAPGGARPEPKLVATGAPSETSRSRRGLWIGLGIAALVVAAIVVYFALYGGGSGGGGGTGGGGGGYFMLPLALDQARRLRRRILQ